MAYKINERVKADIGLIAQTINNSNVTGDYYDLRGYRKARAICIDGASVVNKVTKVEFLQATAAAGTGAKVVKQSNASDGTESSASNVAAATKITDVTECSLTLSSGANGETVTITDVDGTDYVFIAHTDTTVAADLQFKIDGTDAQDATVLHGLINGTYGPPGVTSTDGGAGVLTLKATDKGAGTFSVATDAVTHFVPAITKQLLVSEIDVSDLDIAGGFFFVAVKVTKAGNGIVGVVLERETKDYPPVDAAGISTIL